VTLVTSNFNLLGGAGFKSLPSHSLKWFFSHRPPWFSPIAVRNFKLTTTSSLHRYTYNIRCHRIICCYTCIAVMPVSGSAMRGFKLPSPPSWSFGTSGLSTQRMLEVVFRRFGQPIRSVLQGQTDQEGCDCFVKYTTIKQNVTICDTCPALLIRLDFMSWIILT
jgi:hypothetical protein